MLSQQSGGVYEAMVVHQAVFLPVLKQDGQGVPGMVASGRYWEGAGGQESSWSSEVMSSLSGQQQAGDGVFSLVSQLSPQGSDALEDLVMSSADNPEEYVLVVVRRRGERIEVFRRLYRVPGVVQ
jgi:hypothetical protein